MAIDTPLVPQTRRALLAGALGGLAAAVATALGRPGPANAAAGDSLIIGSETNNAGSANTQLLTNSNVVAFKLLQNGPGTALMGYATPATGATRGVYGRTDSPNGYGVQARNAGAAGTGAAVQAIGVNNHGIDASTDTIERYAVKGVNNGSGAIALLCTGGTAVRGESSNSFGLLGISTSHWAVLGDSTNSWGVVGRSVSSDGVHGTVNGQFSAGVSGVGGGTSGHGVVGSITSNSGTASGVYGASAGDLSYAGYFEGHVGVTGTIENAGGLFKIDHPLDPANRLLQHSAVQSPDMKNVYDGVATLDAKGAATVTLPGYVAALNRDFRYQLTPIGAAAPELHVKSKVTDDRFSIAGGRPAQQVSWQLTGIRKDAWANAHRIAVEHDKTDDQRGLYLHPLEHGQARSKGVDHPMQQRLTAAREYAEAVRARS